jgi:hypothetical protein
MICKESAMGRYFAVAILAWMVSLPAYPVLNVGAMAPNFVTQASLGGKAFIRWRMN